MNEQVEAVAQAIWEASPGTLPWLDVPDDSVTKGHYRRMAAAAIDALQLTAETRRCDLEHCSGGHSRQRLVGPWVEVVSQ